MKTTILLFFASLINVGLANAQPKGKSDTTTVLPTDIYSNFNKDVYRPLPAFTMAISMEKTDTMKVTVDSYEKNIIVADFYFQKQDFGNALTNYNNAFAGNHDLGKVKDRYKSACCYAMLNKPDSAFLQLQKITEKGKYYNVEEIEAEKYFIPLHNDPRWFQIIKKVKQNKKELNEELEKNTPGY